MAKAIKVRFHADAARAFKVALSAVTTCGYAVNSTDKDSGVISFESGMSIRSYAGQHMSLHILDMEDGAVEVNFTGVRKSGPEVQLADFGEANLVASKVVRVMEKSLGKAEVVSGKLRSETSLGSPLFIVMLVIGLILMVGVVALLIWVQTL